MKPLQIILLIDDDEDDRQMFCEAANEVDPRIECIHAEDGVSALELLSDYTQPAPDIIFLDLNMPKLHGKQCLQEIKKIEKIKNVPVIIYSTSNLKEDRDEATKFGAAGFLNKPTEFKTLRKHLQTILNGNLFAKQ